MKKFVIYDIFHFNEKQLQLRMVWDGIGDVPCKWNICWCANNVDVVDHVISVADFRRMIFSDVFLVDILTNGWDD